MARWKSALAVLWRTEPAFPLVVYLLLAAAQVANVDLLGGQQHQLVANAQLGPGRLSAGSAGSLLVYAYFVWRMWIGGYISWTLSLLWTVTVIRISCGAIYESPSLPAVLTLALGVASLLPLLSPAVLNRVDPRSRRASLAGAA